MPVAIADDAASGIPGSITMTGDQIYGFLYSPSARRLHFPGSNENLRHKTKTYCRGYAERSSFEASDGTSWMWRRIVFASKDITFRNAFPANTIDFNTATQGQMRAAWNFLNGNAAGNSARDAAEQKLFQGTVGDDWVDRFAARVNTKNVTILGMRTTHLKGGNTDGQFYTQNDWFPVNKNLVYLDREEGADEKVTLPWSTMGKPGIGNIFVYDIFAAANGVVGDTLEWVPQGTYYWHER